MGKNSWRRKRQKRDGAAANGEGGWVVKRDPTSGKNIVPGSPVFEAYYQAQQIVAPGPEWRTFMDTLAVPLPASFRVNLDCDFSDKLVAEIEAHVAKRVQVNGQEVAPIKRLEFFQGGKAFQMAIDRHTIRKDTSLTDFHELIKLHAEAGTITRQETVSMIPPVVLDVQPHHKVLDMCAAPGSKTSQMLETLSKGCSRTGQEPEGYIIANDCDTARAYMLVHHCKRINTVALCVTTHKAQLFPARGLGGKEDSTEMEAAAAAAGVPRVAMGYFDRVLCDVPCSGDGTVRKTLNIWRTWSPNQGLALHPMQIAIARRGAALVKVGGLMVYSTCSLNPIENEAVVLSLLQESDGALELVDPRSLLPGLKVRPGMHTWQVIDAAARLNGKAAAGAAATQEGQEESEVEAALKKAGLKAVPNYEAVPEACRRWIKPTCFPPEDPQVAAALNLHYCMRCLPHDQDTGGFFIALLRKNRPLPKPGGGATRPGGVADDEDVEIVDGEDQGGDGAAEPALATPAPPQPQKPENERVNKPRKAFVPKEFFVPLADEAWQGIKTFYGIRDDFPHDRLFLRRDGSKVVILLSKGLVEDVHLSTNCQLQLVNAGTRIFDRASAERSACTYRLAQDGMAYLLPYMTKRVVKVGPQALAAMAMQGVLDPDVLEDGPRQEIAGLEMGAFVATLDPVHLPKVTGTMVPGIASFALMCWKGFGAKMNVMCIAHDRFIFQNRLEASGLVTAEQLASLKPPPKAEAKKEEEEEQEQEKEAPAPAAEEKEADGMPVVEGDA